MKFVTAKVLYNLNLMQSLPTQWNQLGDVSRGCKLIRYVFSKVIECLEQNIRNQIDYKRPSNTRQINWIQNIQIEMWKYKAVKCIEI